VRIITAVMMIILMGEVMVATGLAATYTKASDNQIGVVTEKTETMTIAEIKHELEGIDNDLARIEASKAPFLERMAKYEELLRQCDTLGVKEPVIAPTDEIKPIVEPIETP
jgi:hypothetical protein